MSPSPRAPGTLVIASRGSRLALRQAQSVAELITAAHDSVTVSIVTVSTAGDRDRRPFRAIGGKGLFVKEVERALVDGRADVAVHSAKDLTAELAQGCSIVCVPRRGEVADVVVGGEGATGEERLGSLRTGAVIGTSSMRRRVLIADARSDLEVVDLRGNLDTRLGRVAAGEIDAAVVAAAGLARLEAEASFAPIAPDWWVPAPAQGALAIEALSDRSELAELLAPLVDPSASAEVSCERAFARRLEGGCSVPLGCLARVNGARLVATGWLGSPLGGQSIRDRISGPAEEAASLGAELADAILAGGGEDVLADIGASDALYPSPP